MAAVKKNFDYKNYIETVTLEDIKKENKVEILFAIESGSRMWGFASPDSDFDVRCVYLYDDYRDNFSVSKQKDVISHVDANPLIDVQGWDIRKTISLMANGNGTLIDWFSSPIIYEQKDGPVALLKMLQRDLLRHQSIQVKFLYHHRQLLRRSIKNAEQSLNSNGEVLAKRILYALRSALIFDTVFENIGSPMDIVRPLLTDHLLEYSTEFREEVSTLLSLKGKAGEKQAFINLDDFPRIKTCIYNTKDRAIPAEEKKMIDFSGCDAVLRAILSR